MPQNATLRKTARKPRPGRWTAEVQSRETQYDLKHRAIILAAGRAMAQRGFDAMSLDEVARSLHVTKPALYYYVKSKHEILFECHKLAFELGAACRAKALAEGKNGLEKFLIYIRAYIAGLVDELDGGAAMTEYHHLLPQHQRILQPMRDEYDHFYRGLIVEGIRDGSIAKVDPKMATFFIIGAIRGIHRWYNPRGAMKGPEIADTFAELIRNTLKARA